MEEHLASVSKGAVKLKLLLMTVYMLKVPVQEELERTMSPENIAKYTSAVKHVKRDVQAAFLQLSAAFCTDAICRIPSCSRPIVNFTCPGTSVRSSCAQAQVINDHNC